MKYFLQISSSEDTEECLEVNLALLTLEGIMG